MNGKKRRRSAADDLHQPGEQPLSEDEARARAEYLESTAPRRRFALPGCVLIAGAIFTTIGLVTVAYLLVVGTSAGLAAAAQLAWDDLLENPIVGPVLTAFLVVILLFSMILSFYYWLRHQLRSIIGCFSLLIMAAMVGALVWLALQGDFIDLDEVRALIE
jgi:magnesium-transporting ATPase (P-type)